MTANLKNDSFYLYLIKDGKLKITKSGRAFNLTTGKEIATSRMGYRKLSWAHPVTKKIIQIQLHRLVWITFKGPFYDATLQVNHIDGDKTNCRLGNLESTDNLGNVRHAIEKGLIFIPKGDDRPNATWTDEEVLKLRSIFLKELTTPMKVAKQFNVSCSTASWMLRGKTYKHLNGTIA